MDSRTERVIEKDNPPISNNIRDSFNIVSGHITETERFPDIEAEFARILQEEIEKEFEHQTGMTKAQRDQQFVDELVKFAKEHGIGQ